MGKKKVRVHPYFDAEYCSYFLQGLVDLFGFSAIEFSKEGFPDLDPAREILYGEPLYLILLEDNKKVFIETWDEHKIGKQAMAWCDVYAKSNLCDMYEDLSDVEIRKLKSCEPFFAIRLSSNFHIFSTFVRTFDFRSRDFINHVRKHLYRIYRYHRSLRHYAYDTESVDHYVYFHATIRGIKYSEANLWRSYFVQACIDDQDIHFEGGFQPRSDGREPREMTYLINRKEPWIGMDQYLHKTKKSMIAFYSPSVKGTHSWRLGEYFALEKAVLSTNNLRKCTIDLVHGENIHFVEPTFETIKEGVRKLKCDKVYRKKLEKGAYDCYLKYGTPKKLIEHIIS